MRKIFVIAAREYNAAVRTKAFLISLLMMPLLMGGSLAVQTLLRDKPSTEEKRFALIDRTPGTKLFPVVEQKLKTSSADQAKEHWILEQAVPEDETPEAMDRLREKLSGEVRRGDLLGFVEIGPDVFEPAPKPRKPETQDRYAVRYFTNRPTETKFANLVQELVTNQARDVRAKKLHLDPDKVQGLVEPVPLDLSGLTQRDPTTGKIEAAQPQSMLSAFLAPFGLLMLMFMVVLMTSTPLMQGVLEEKMQRIAEVLLGSVQPFQMMLGKLVGMTAVSLTISGVYLSGGWWVLHHFGYAEFLSPGLVAWFLVYQSLAALMYGSLFAAVGAACTDMKETQTLMWPVMLLVCVPMFMVGNVIQDPNGSMVKGMSFFPFATPMLMIARMGVPPGVPWWQPAVGVVGVLAATIVCVWAAGRIFRVGILMQGKGARFGEIVRWVFRG